MEKVILITGASSGLGKALAGVLAAQGHQVFGTSRNPKPGDLPYRMLRMDVTEASSVGSAMDTLIQEAGRLDVLINNAGIGIAGPTEAVQLKNAQKVIDTNFYGTLRTVQAALPHLRKTKGRIINVSSVGAAFGLPFRGIYSASKSAVGMLTEALRMEVAATGVQACTVLAGDIQTPISAHRIKVTIPTTNCTPLLLRQFTPTSMKKWKKGCPPMRWPAASLDYLQQVV